MARVPHAAEGEQDAPPALPDLAAVIGQYDQIKGVHPACNMLPLIDDGGFQQLCSSIERDGQLEPVRIDSQGQLLDDRCRLLACHALEIAANIVLSNDNPWAIAMSNVARRHLNAGQRAVIGSKLLAAERAAADARKKAGLRAGGQTPLGNKSGVHGRAAKIVGDNVGVSADSIDKAARLTPNLEQQVMRGKRSQPTTLRLNRSRTTAR